LHHYSTRFAQPSSPKASDERNTGKGGKESADKESRPARGIVRSSS